jgi:hypothetical protein
MLSWKALLVALPVALAGAWGLAEGGSRLQATRREMARLEEQGRAEGESFLRTLQGSHAERQLEAFDRRRVLALELARARRDQLLGLLGLVSSGLIAAGGTVVGRIAAEVAENGKVAAGGSGPSLS